MTHFVRRPALRLALLACVLPLAAMAQEWPARPITLVVPFPPGGGNDLVARIVAPAMQQALGQSVLVDNKPGVGGTLGVAFVVKAPPDGYTLSVCATGNMAVAPALYSKPLYAVSDLMPVALIVKTYNVWVASPDLPANTLQEFIALAKKDPGKYNFGSSGNGTTPHLAGEAMKARYGVDMQHVPYKGSTPVYTDLSSGRVSILMDSLISALPMIEGGRVKVLAPATPQRLPKLPNIPTVAEQGLADLGFGGWVGLCAPLGTPPAVVQKVAAAVKAAVAQPALRDQLTAQVTNPAGDGPEAFGALIQRDAAAWKKVIVDSKAQLD